MPIKENEMYLLRLLVNRIRCITLSSTTFSIKNAIAILPKTSDNQCAPIIILDIETDNARASKIETTINEYLVFIFLVASDIQTKEMPRIVAAWPLGKLL